MTELKAGMPVLLNWNGEAFYRGRVRELSWALTQGKASAMFEGVIEEGPYTGCKLLCTEGNYPNSWKELPDGEPMVHPDPLQMTLPNVLGDLPEVGELLVVQRSPNDWQTARVTCHDPRFKRSFWAVYLSGVWKGNAFQTRLKYEGSIWFRLGANTPSVIARLNQKLAEAHERIVELEAKLTAGADVAVVYCYGLASSRRPQQGDTIFFLPKNPRLPSVASTVQGRIGSDGFWIIGPDGLRLNLLDNEKDRTWSWFRLGPSSPGGSLL